MLMGVKCGKLHKNGQEELVWARTLKSIVTDGYLELYTWDEIHARVRTLECLFSTHAEHIHQKKYLPIDLFNQLVDMVLSRGSSARYYPANQERLPCIAWVS